jgi:hypothetical protein
MCRPIHFRRYIHLPVKAICGRTDMSNRATLITMADHTRTGARRGRYSWNRRAAISLGDDVCGFWLFPPPGRRGLAGK